MESPERVLSMNLATLRNGSSFAEMVDDCLLHGVTAISPWRDQIETAGLAEAARIVQSNGLRVTGLCRGGMFPAADPEGRQQAIEDNLRAIDEAATLGADCLVLVVGGLPAGSKDLAGARQMVADGIWAMLPYAKASGVPLAIEPLHPMYAADRACVNTIDQALDICQALGDGVGVAIDVYHTWWDPNLALAIERAGKMDCILAHHICDWLVPTNDLLLDRGMMGDGVIDLKGIRKMIEAAGYFGPQEVEIFSRDNWWKKSGNEVVRTCVERFETVC
ncbi:MAG: sugar phosphate isomerase/epimerase family protein [Devosia sp.]